MPFIRALVANTVFYTNATVWLIACLPILLGPAHLSERALKAFTKTTIVLLRLFVGIRWEIQGLENIPKDGLAQAGCIIASKHQSTWETFGLIPYVDRPTFILKKELMSIPLVGWYLAKIGMIPIERSRNAAALREMTKAAKQAMKDGRQLIIFPEGTRRPVDAPPDYKSGIAHMYKQLGVPLVPAALNSGLFWPRNTMQRYPGLLTIKLMNAIPSGEDPRAVQIQLQELIEVETNRLVATERARNPQLPPA